jgi:hypothetical protein
MIAVTIYPYSTPSTEHEAGFAQTEKEKETTRFMLGVSSVKVTDSERSLPCPIRKKQAHPSTEWGMMSTSSVYKSSAAEWV